MKIRITKKGLPKHQIKGQVELNQPAGTELTLPQNPSTNFAWATVQQQPVPKPPQQPKLYEVSNQGEPVKQTTPVVPIKRFSKNEWMPANQDKLSYGVNKGLDSFQKFLNSKPMRSAMTAGTGIMGVVDAVSPFVQMMDTRKKNKAIERAYRETLLSQGPVDYTENRGDYEINTGMVDPYNTGAKSKGQFANAYYTPMMEIGGVTLGPISFSDTPVFRNVYEEAAVVSSYTPSRKASYNPAPAAEVNVVLDANFEDYAEKAEKYIRKVNPNTDITGEMLAAGAQRAYQKYGRTVPVEMALAQLQQEGYLAKGSKANKPQRTRNPFNVGNTDDGSVVNHANIQSGINTYFDLMARNYLVNKTPNDLLQNFVNRSGNRYATDRNYEASLKRIIKNVQNSFEFGGAFDQEQLEPMKIRIVKTPTTEMEYGGQLGYGFDLGGRRVYTDMPESMSDSVSNTLGPVPEEMATIEAEKGETILSDVDGDGMKEHMKIGGKRHSEGGTPLAADPGDFVFSDTKKMKIKSPQLLALFGKGAKAGGYTPAQIAKQYDINKYKAILQDPNSDSISKRTAEMMISNYEKKLGMLSLVQEAKKGFPSGIPSVAESVLPEAKYGGYLEQYQDAGPVKVKRAEIGNYEKQGYKRVGNSKIWQLDGKKVEQVDPTKGTTTTKVTPGKKYVPNENAWWRSLTPAQKAAHNARVRKMIKEDPQYQDKTETITTPDTCPEGYALNPTTGKCEKITPDVKQITYDETPGTPDVPGIETTTGNIPFEWTQQDKNNLLLALTKRGRVQKFPSVRRDVNPVMPDFRNMDWRGRAAELQGTYNSQMNTLGTYQSPTSLAANASFMAGQQAENLINRAIDPIEQANVNIYNQVAGQRAGIMNQAIAGAAQNQFLRSQDRAVLNQQYINALNDADSGITQAINQGITNAAGIYNTNQVESPYYYYDPRTQKMQFNSPNAKAAYQAAMRNAGPNDGDIAEQYLAIRRKLVGVPEDQKDDVTRELMGLGRSGGGRMSSTNYPFNPRMNRTTVQTPFPAYTNPMLMAQQLPQQGF